MLNKLFFWERPGATLLDHARISAGVRFVASAHRRVIRASRLSYELALMLKKTSRDVLYTFGGTDKAGGFARPRRVDKQTERRSVSRAHPPGGVYNRSRITGRALRPPIILSSRFICAYPTRILFLSFVPRSLSPRTTLTVGHVRCQSWKRME